MSVPIRLLMIVGVAAISGLLLAHPASGQEPEYSGTVVAYCQINGEPVIEAENTGTGDLTLDVAGTGFPLNVDAPIITVQWPSDASGPLPQAAWRLLIPGTETVIDSGTLTLPDCTPEPEYSGTVVAYCQTNGEPVIEAENTGTGDLTLDVAGTGFPLNVDAPIITVQWPSDASGPLPQAAWRLLIPGTETVIDSGTLTLPDCTPTTDPPVTDPPVTDPPVTDPPVTHPSVSSLPKTGSANWWIAAMAGGFVLVGSALYVVGRRPN